MLEDTEQLDRKIAETQAERDTVIEMNKALIREHAVTGIAQDEFDRKARAYEERFKKTDTRLARLNEEKQDRILRVNGIRRFRDVLAKQAGAIDVWDEQAWNLLVRQVTVYHDGRVDFLFKGENTITVTMD